MKHIDPMNLLGPDHCALMMRLPAGVRLIVPLRIVKRPEEIDAGNMRRAGKTEGWKR